MCSAVVEQVIVDEFRTVTRINPDDREREPGNHPLERFKHPYRCFVLHGPVVVPISPRSDRDLRFQ